MYLIATETLNIHAGRTLSEEKRIPIIHKGFKSQRDHVRLLLDVLQTALSP
jgi:hypothetical protein